MNASYLFKAKIVIMHNLNSILVYLNTLLFIKSFALIMNFSKLEWLDITPFHLLI